MCVNPCEHSCWMSKPQFKPRFNDGGVWIASDPVPDSLPPAGEATCGACQWLAGYKAGYAVGRALLPTDEQQSGRNTRTVLETLREHQGPQYPQEPPHAAV